MIITSATWANVDQTAAVVVTPESGAIAISQVDRPAEWQAFLDWVSSGNTVAPLPGPSAAAQRNTAFEGDATRADLIDKLRNATLAQIDTYVDNNVTNLADARAMFKKILKVLALNVQR